MPVYLRSDRPTLVNKGRRAVQLRVAWRIATALTPTNYTAEAALILCRVVKESRPVDLSGLMESGSRREGKKREISGKPTTKFTVA